MVLAQTPSRTLLKLADFSQVVGQDGKINEETLKAALNKVLEDVPGLKAQAAGTTGFVQVGAASGNTGAGQAQQARATTIFRMRILFRRAIS